MRFSTGAADIFAPARRDEPDLVLNIAACNTSTLLAPSCPTCVSAPATAQPSQRSSNASPIGAAGVARPISAPTHASRRRRQRAKETARNG